MELGPLPADPEAPERKRMFQLMASINIPMIMEDTRALLAFAAGDPPLASIGSAPSAIA